MESIMPQKEHKHSFIELISRYGLVKTEDKETQSPKHFLITVVSCIMFFICLTVLKLPYTEENAPLLNCYYLLLFIFTACCYMFHACDKDSLLQNKVLLFLKVITLIIFCFGIYLYVSHFDYIQAHLSE